MTDTFGLSDDCEITLEVDPGTFDESFLQAVHSLGVNRLSVGIQSFDDDVLKKCGRAHTAAQAIDAIEKIHRSAINNFSIDLISSLPFLTLDKWESTLRAATDTGSTHMSIYDLQVEDKTAFGRWYSPGVFPLPGDAESAEMYRAGVRTLTAAGYEHYEASVCRWLAVCVCAFVCLDLSVYLIHNNSSYHNIPPRTNSHHTHISFPFSLHLHSLPSHCFCVPSLGRSPTMPNQVTAAVTTRSTGGANPCGASAWPRPRWWGGAARHGRAPWPLIAHGWTAARPALRIHDRHP